jgi:hypothetical protein
MVLHDCPPFWCPVDILDILVKVIDKGSQVKSHNHHLHSATAFFVQTVYVPFF